MLRPTLAIGPLFSPKAFCVGHIPFNHPSQVGHELDYIAKAIAAGHLSGDGAFTRQCTDLIRKKTGAESALLTHSCTAALEMAALLCSLRPGDEVIMPSFTFVSTANAVALRGATPVFVDIQADTFNIDPDRVLAVLTPRTRAITAVHYAGIVADMDPLREIADAHHLYLTEDAAQAYGSTYHGRPAGSLGDIAAFSFHETKNIICGEGGALTINRPDLVARAEIIRDKGTNRSRFFRGQVDKYTWVDVGSSFLPSELNAAFLLAQLEQEAAVRSRRLEIWRQYQEAFRRLAGSGRITAPVVPQHCTGNGHLFHLLLRDIDDRAAFIEHMRSRGITTPFHYVPLHSSEGGIKFGRTPFALPVTDSVTDRLVRLPLFYALSDHDVARIVDAALSYFAR